MGIRKWFKAKILELIYLSPNLPHSCCVALNKLLNISVPYFPPLYNIAINCIHSH